MRQFTKEELVEVLRKHAIWMDDEDSEEGKRADLQYADLQYADLRGANGNKSSIKSLQIEKYSITYTHARLFIGCKNYLISEWKDFDDASIAKNGHRSTGVVEKMERNNFQNH